MYFAARCQNIVGGLGLLFLIVGMVHALYVILLANDPWAMGEGPSAPFNVILYALMLPQNMLMLAGGISMHQHKRRWLAIAGAWAGIMPFCGCSVFSLMSGIWALVVLRRPEVKALFAEKQQAHRSVVDTPSGKAT